MKTVPVSKRSRVMKQLLAMARRQDLVLRTPEGDEFMLVLVDDFDYELAKQRANEKLMNFLDERFREARQEKCIPLEQVKRELGLKSDDTKVSRRKAGPHPR
jgi:hypothetical protein